MRHRASAKPDLPSSGFVGLSEVGISGVDSIHSSDSYYTRLTYFTIFKFSNRNLIKNEFTVYKNFFLSIKNNFT